MKRAKIVFYWSGKFLEIWAIVRMLFHWYLFRQDMRSLLMALAVNLLIFTAGWLATLPWLKEVKRESGEKFSQS